MLFDPLDQILGTRSKLRLLRALAPLHRPVSGREAARLAGVSRQAISVLDDLASAGIVRRQETAGQNLYLFNRDDRLAPAILHLFDEEAGRTAELFQRLACIVEESGSAMSAAVFGSAARGEAGPGSDLDLLVIVEDIEAQRSVYDSLVESTMALENDFGVELSPVVLTAERIQRQYAEGDRFILEVLRDGRTVYGRPIEDLIRG